MRVTNTPLFKKYTLWLMTGDTSPQAGQIAPALAHIGQKPTESDHSEKQTG
ncbi:C protein [Escherichia coli 2729250]|nr:C protein [Escherichia coli DEC14D]EIH32404.1 repressor protein C family protein [Escherichia coli 96.0497]EKI15279.1 C protein [Escherichia coli TW15901]ENA48358.1 C protein [Escherichia coli 2729250]ENB92237.1 C protein [Escherichia coli P0299438.11]ENC06596.1 C protein [Escherichia coli P0299438.5]ENC11924.1 C protein [Escherichia coli P0299438.7]EYD94368.1 C protein [Escherichia coli 1-110-08_S4_C3]EYD95391.1 C protein [Escherichia coli 1-110-08_S4_C2]KDA87841.1 C protein [Escherich